MEKVKIYPQDIEALNKLAEVSGMDCWFYMNEDGTASDLEQMIRIDPIKAVSELLDGATTDDILRTGSLHSARILGLAGRIIVYLRTKSI